MKLSQRLRTALKVLSSPELGNSLNGIVNRNYSSGTQTPQQQFKGITYKAIDKIGQSLSVYEPKVSKGNGEYYENHPLYVLYNNPNSIQRTGSDFAHMYGMQMQIYGETFWYLAKGENSNKIKEIYLLNPAQIEVKISDGEVIGYILHKTNGQQVPFEVDEIYHDKFPNPFNEWRGLSILERAAQYVDIELTTTSFTLNYMKNNASPSGIVTLPEMDREAFRQFTSQWREGYEGPENAGKTAFIRGGEADFKAVGATLKDVDQEVTRKMAKEDVLLMLEVPKPLLGGTDDNGFGRSNVEALTYIYTREKINPLMERLDRAFETIINMQPRQVGVSNVGVKVTHESPVPEDKEFIHQQNKDLVNVALTVNEVRQRIGLPPIKGGDELDTSNPVAQAPTGKTIKIVKKKELTLSEKAKAKHNKNEKFRKQVEETNTLYAAKVQKEISKLAGAQEKKVIENINASSKTFEEWLFSVKDEAIKFAKALTPIMIELMQAQTQDAANFITGEVIAITDELRKTTEAYIKQIAGVYNADTITALEKTLSEGQAAGESLAKLKGRVESVFSDAKGYRAERIARTESSRAGNKSVEMTYNQSGWSEVEWFINPGACEFCQTFAGRTKQIGSNFNQVGDVITGTEGNMLQIAYSDIDAPPLHPNCTCSLVPSGDRLGN